MTGEGDGIAFLYTGLGVMAFIREKEAFRRLVLINLEDSAQVVALDELSGATLSAGQAAQADNTAALPPYGYAIFTLGTDT